MSDTNDLKELVQKAAAGDRAAFEELYKETCRSVYFTCLGFLKEEQEARDITQDVYLAALEKLDTLEDAEKFKPWLYRIAANKSMNRLKKMHPFLPGDEQLEGMKPEDNENFLPEEYALNADKRELVLKIVRENCSDVLYQTILLHYFNEFSIAEIAEIMECPEGTVKYRLSAARAKIKEGVLGYEKKSGEKLRSAGAVPFLAALFTAQMEGMQMPLLPTSILDVLPKSTLAASTAKTGGGVLLKSLQFKIAIGITAAVVAVGGVVTAAVLISNRNAEEVSVAGQEENRLEKTTQKKPETTKESETEETATEDGITVEKTTEPVVESQYTYTDMSAIMYAKSSVNVRNLPSADGEMVGALSTNQEVTVTGQCNETKWYRFEYNGSVAYVSNNYLSDTKVETQAVAQPSSNDNGTDQSQGEGQQPEIANTAKFKIGDTVTFNGTGITGIIIGGGFMADLGYYLPCTVKLNISDDGSGWHECGHGFMIPNSAYDCVGGSAGHCAHCSWDLNWDGSISGVPETFYVYGSEGNTYEGFYISSIEENQIH